MNHSKNQSILLYSKKKDFTKEVYFTVDFKRRTGFGLVFWGRMQVIPSEVNITSKAKMQEEAASHLEEAWVIE